MPNKYLTKIAALNHNVEKEFERYFNHVEIDPDTEMRTAKRLMDLKGLPHPTDHAGARDVIETLYDVTPGVNGYQMATGLGTVAGSLAGGLGGMIGAARIGGKYKHLTAMALGAAGTLAGGHLANRGLTSIFGDKTRQRDQEINRNYAGDLEKAYDTLHTRFVR